GCPGVPLEIRFLRARRPQARYARRRGATRGENGPGCDPAGGPGGRPDAFGGSGPQVGPGRLGVREDPCHRTFPGLASSVCVLATVLLSAARVVLRVGENLWQRLPSGLRWRKTSRKSLAADRAPVPGGKILPRAQRRAPSPAGERGGSWRVTSTPST